VGSLVGYAQDINPKLNLDAWVVVQMIIVITALSIGVVQSNTDLKPVQIVKNSLATGFVNGLIKTASLHTANVIQTYKK